jgi:hypothetical protein
MSIIILALAVIATIAVLVMRVMRPKEVEAAELDSAAEAQAAADQLAKDGIAARTSTRSNPGVSAKPVHVVLVSVDDLDEAHALLDGRPTPQEPEEASIHAAQG